MVTIILNKPLLKIWDFLKTFYQAIYEAKHCRAVYHELSKLSDYELHDMGISRSDIIRLVYQDK